MRDDLLRLRRQFERARTWEHGSRIAVRTPVLDALLNALAVADLVADGKADAERYEASRAKLKGALREPSRAASVEPIAPGDGA